MKLWGGRFNKVLDQTVESFTASIPFDYCLASVDILGSIAHVTMLGQCDIIDKVDAQTLIHGLQNLQRKINAGQLEFSIQDEDIHMNIERHLHQTIGPVAGKLHTGRSRNDQVALDLHLYLREESIAIVEQLYQLQTVLVEQASKHLETILPGYTHLQRAQPVTLAHHLLAYGWMLQRDIERLISSWPRINTMPLGAGALAGSSFNIDRTLTAELLGFAALYENSMDAVSDRDFVVEFLAHASLIMLHLSRLAEELILWSSREFGFIELDDAYCTGSSMMPQKKNPDVPELIRGKTGRVYGALMGILTVLKALPLCYNKDLQEDKEGLFDTLRTLHQSLALLTPLLMTMQVNAAVMHNAVSQDFSNATQLADYLVKRGLPFREAHAIVGRLVQHCIAHHCLLTDLPLTLFQQYYPHIKDCVYQWLNPQQIIKTYALRGGTAPAAVKEQLILLQDKLLITIGWLTTQQNQIKNTSNKLCSCKSHAPA